ncbi:GAF domain-containing protein [Streptomyces sp. CA-132043]|uniref:GAF domain-containing protein n=1 Tax=Streptomyces sp. CA-132043 TaxID=3240048 RepID=UPI003D931F42
MAEGYSVADPAMADCLHQIGAGRLPLHACADVLGLDGLALLLTTDTGLPEPMRVHGPLTEPLEDLQLVHGQGPSPDAAQHGMTVLAPDLTDLAASRWTGLAPDVRDLGVGAVFAFPLRIGTVRIGALSGHRREPGIMAPQQIGGADALADAAAHAVLRQTSWLSDQVDLPFGAAHRAAGVLTERLGGVSLEHAWLRLRAHAFGHDRSLLDTADAVLRGRVADL